MANWQNFAGLWINKPNLCTVRIQTDGSSYHIYYSFDGLNYIQDLSLGPNNNGTFPDLATAQAALATLMGGLG
jgi:hypothetical protein